MMGELNVCFQIDTDNRENFPSANAFRSFKKQRDSFYDILRVWEENHAVPGWTFEIALGGIIRTMLTLHNDAINYYHFARLFKSQLLISCIKNGEQTDVDDESLSVLRNLKKINPEKLTQLRKRLVTPLPSQTQLEGPSFPGAQEFFKDFILHAFNPVFYVHLENCLVHEILELNDSQFSASEIEDSETIVDGQTQQNFMTCLTSLRLLAKMLGLLVSLPYRSESSNSKEIMVTQIEIRSRVLPSLNLHICLHSAVKFGKLSITIPWMAKYLAMLDTVSLRLPYYKQVIEMLYYVQKALNKPKFSTADGPVSQKTLILLKSTLGWLFELPNMPKDYLPFWEKMYEARKLWNFVNLEEYYVQENVLLKIPTTSTSTTKCNLDKLDLINDRALRTCCPRPGVHVPVGSGNMNTNNFNSNKHITPVSSPLHKFGGAAGAKHLQLKLEEAFFHGQPISLRKTVDFVAERVASTCIKHICNTLLTPSRESNLAAFRKIIRKKQSSLSAGKTDETTPADFKASFESDMSSLASRVSKELREKCETTVSPICQSRVSKSLESLLAEDTQPIVKKMCTDIAVRLANERINQWIQSHIVGDSLFIKDMELELNRHLRNNSPLLLDCVQDKQHNPEAFSPTTIIDHIRALIWDVLDENRKTVTFDSIIEALNKLHQTLNERVDLIVGPEKVLYTLSVDLSLCLAAHRMDLFTDKLQDEFIKLWALDRWNTIDPNPPMHRILSPRNVMLLAQPDNKDVWLAFGKFLKRLLEKKILTIDILSDQCVALFRQDWPAPILKHLSKCLTEAIKDFKSSDEATEKVKYLLDWIAETYHQIEFSGDFEAPG